MEEKEPSAEEKMREEKKEEAEKPAEEKKPAPVEAMEAKDAKEEQTPPPPQEIILKVYMHCEGCARKIRRCLRGFEGVEDVITDCKTQKVIVKGEKAVPLKVLDRVQRKSHRQVELLSPIPKPPPAEPEKKGEVKEPPKPEEKKEDQPQVISVVLKVHMHCEACSLEIKKRIIRMKGVEEAEPDLKNSQVKVKGVFDPPVLVDYVYKRTGKHAVIVKQEPEKKENKGKDGEGDGAKEEKKGEEGGGANKKQNKGAGTEEGKENKEKDKEGDNKKSDTEDKPTAEATAAEAAAAVTEEIKVVELKKNEYYYYPPRYAMELYAYPPQIFSDENPNACSVM